MNNNTIEKFIGIEIEFGNHFCRFGNNDDPSDAAKALFRAHKAIFTNVENNRQDCGVGLDEFGAHQFRCYVDHSHFEISTPVTASAADLVIWQRRALQLAACCKKYAETMSKSLRIHCSASNRLGAAWGFHVNLLVSRKIFDHWREQQWYPLFRAWVPFLASSPILFGTGKVGAENGKLPATYQLSQRADFIDKLVELETVSSKSLINERDEPLADPLRYARLHVTAAFDLNLCEFASWLKFGITQVMLALIEAEAEMPDLQLEDPIGSLATVSRDLSLSAKLKLSKGSKRTAIDIQEELAAFAMRSVDAGILEERIVPSVRKITDAWLDTIQQLRNKKDNTLRRRLDWLAKKNGLDRWRKHLGISWEDPRLLELDLRYAELGTGWFETLERHRLVDRLEDFLPIVADNPTSSGRDGVRSRILEKFKENVVAVNWHYVCINVTENNDEPIIYRIKLDDPLDTTKIQKVVDEARNANELIQNLPQHCYRRSECPSKVTLLSFESPFKEEL